VPIAPLAPATKSHVVFSVRHIGWISRVYLCNVRREEPIDIRLPEPIVDRADGMNPEHEALLADSVGLALLVVLETLSPPERLAFVLHDIFAVPFDAIAPIVDRSPEAARQLASRARRRIPAVVLRADLGPPGGFREVRGAEAVSGQAVAYAELGLVARPALINGVAGVVSFLNGQPFSIGAVTVRGGQIVAIDILADPERLRRLDLTLIDD
jgi:Sigma-70, region 4